MGLKHFVAGFIACLILMGCAGFAFKYYGLSGVSYRDGTLLGPTADKDIPFVQCEPTAAMPHPCVVMFATEFLAFKQDYIDTQNQLSACQHGLK